MWVVRDDDSTMREQMPGPYDILIINRNKDWTQQIDRLIAGRGKHFIAAGAGHMVGADSVPAMLAERGHSVAWYGLASQPHRSASHGPALKACAEKVTGSWLDSQHRRPIYCGS